MYHIFGYGSLLSPASVSLTIQRSLTQQDLTPGMLRGFTRTWTASCDVTVHFDNQKRRERALFLDLSRNQEKTCNGSLLQVSDEEIVKLDARERPYRRIMVDVDLGDKSVPAFTYMVEEALKSRRGIILERYVSLIKEALLSYSLEFREIFWQTTEEYQKPLIPGIYTFFEGDS